MSTFQTRLAAEYSSIFSSGLLAPPRTSLDADRTPTSSPAPSPMGSPALRPAMDISPLPPRDMPMDRSTTPTPGSYRPLAPPSPRTPQQTLAAPLGGRQSVRRRKSSLGMAQSPLPLLKNRPSLILRSRSSSIAEGPLSAMPSFNRAGSDGSVQTTSLMGRLRSGSVGGALRAGARRLVRKPSKAPPTMPLPPVPSGASAAVPGLLPPPILTFPNPFAPSSGVILRRPLARRAQSSIDVINEHNGSPSSSGAFDTNKLARALSAPLEDEDAEMKEN